jgi:hypothetical protein
MKSRKMRWVEHVARLGKKSKAECRWGNLREGVGFEELRVEERIILPWILKT